MAGIEQRAAEYFGVSSSPRTSVKVGRYKVMLIVPRGHSRTLVVYSEEGRRPRGEYFILDGDKPQRLVNAIVGLGDLVPVASGQEEETDG